MKSEDSLWDTGKDEDISSPDSKEDTSTLDLSEVAPEKNSEDINLELPKKIEEKDEDWAIPLAEDVDGLNLRTIGIVGTIVILLLTGTLYVLLRETIDEVQVPNEKYEEQINYNVNGFLDFQSNLDVPIPFGFFDNDIIINNLDVTFSGDLNLGIEGPQSIIKNGYGESINSVFKKYIEQNLDDVDGTFTESCEECQPAELKNSKVVSSQDQYVDSGSLNIIRSDITSNASTAKISGIGQRWAWQSATDWIPRQHSSGILPHGNAYIGKTLTEGDSGTLYESGIEFTTKVTEGEKIKDYDTLKLQVITSYVSDSLLGYEYDYSYIFSFYMSDVSSLPLKFEFQLNSEAKSPGTQLYSIDLKYTATAKDIFEGYEFVPTKSYDSFTGNSEGEFLNWNDGAPAFGTCNENSQLNENFNLQTGIASARDNISSFDNYIKDQQARNEEAFVIEANYSSKNDYIWNFTMAYNNERTQKVDGWNLDYREIKNNSSIIVNGSENELDNPILKMDDIEAPLTVCSAEKLMTDFEEIAEWAIDENSNNVNYQETTLILGQNLISEQSLSSPTSILDFGNIDLISAISDLNSGNLNLNDYSNNIDVDTAGSYAYFLDKNGGSDSLGYDHQEVAGIDAKNGLVMFNLQSRSVL